MKRILTSKKRSAAPSQVGKKAARLEARVSPEAKALCQRAADVQGRTLTDFVVHSAVEAANRIVRETELVELTRRDRLAFVEALLNAPTPNARLTKAMQRHTQLVSR
jgi:uncharacterized protein (DUF1778 family)